MRLLRAAWRPALVLLALIGIWELYVDLGGVSSLILPPPHAVAKSLYEDRSLLWSNFLVTAKEVVLGILLAAVAGFASAVAVHRFVTIRRSFYPLLVASQAVPVVVIAPILVFWLGFGLAPKLIVIALVSFFSIVVATLAGFGQIDPDLIKLMRTFDASRLRMFRHVELPTALPGLFTGARIAVAVAAIGAVLAEQNGSNAGLGYVLLQSIPQLETARAVAAVVILSALSIGLFALLGVIERLAVPWAYQSSGDQTE